MMARILPALLLLLFFSTLLAQPQSKREKSAQPLGPRIYFPVTTRDTGNIPEGPEYRFRFPFQNRGDAPLVITRVQGAGGSFYAYAWPKAPVMPGQWDTVYALYGSQGRPGPFHKSVFLYCNDTMSAGPDPDNNGLFTLSVKGFVIQANTSAAPYNLNLLKTDH